MILRTTSGLISWARSLWRDGVLNGRPLGSPPQSAPGKTGMLPGLMLVFATMAILVVDTITPREIAFAVFYIVIILFSALFFRSQRIQVISTACILFAAISYALTIEGSHPAGLANLAISIIAIIATTYLVIRIQTAERNAQLAQNQLLRFTRIATLNELTLSIAHEINQPLAAISINSGACLRWLNQKPPNLEEVRTALRRLIEDTDRASAVVTRYRDLSRKQIETRAVVEINPLVQDTLDILHPVLRDKNVFVSADLPDRLPSIIGDKVLLQQVLINVLTNSLEADATHIRVTARSDSSDALFLEIVDNGRGVPADRTDAVFDAFYSTKATGYGLGLTMCRTIIEKHAGQISVQAASPAGTLVSIRLPQNRGA